MQKKCVSVDFCCLRAEIPKENRWNEPCALSLTLPLSSHCFICQRHAHTWLRYYWPHSTNIHIHTHLLPRQWRIHFPFKWKTNLLVRWNVFLASCLCRFVFISKVLLFIRSSEPMHPSFTKRNGRPRVKFSLKISKADTVEPEQSKKKTCKWSVPVHSTLLSSERGKRAVIQITVSRTELLSCVSREILKW